MSAVGADGAVSASADRYSRGAITLHWITALAGLLMIPLGLYGASVETTLGASAMNVHKLLGITVLGLTIVRLGWRLGNSPPSLPQDMAPILRLPARATHALFYALLLAMPVSGWWMTSAFPERHPIEAGLFTVPYLPVPISMEAAGAAHQMHGAGAWLTIGLLALHIGAALYHHIINRDHVLRRMLPFGRS